MQRPGEMEEILIEDMEASGMTPEEIDAYLEEEEAKSPGRARSRPPPPRRRGARLRPTPPRRAPPERALRRYDRQMGTDIGTPRRRRRAAKKKKRAVEL